MTFTFNDLERIIDDGMFEGEHRDWFREIWRIVERRGMNSCSGRFDVIRFYRLVYQLCALYFGFTNVLWGSSPDEFLISLDVDYSLLMEDDECDPECEEDVKNYIMSLITESDFPEARELFSGISRSVIFTSLYCCLNSENFSFEDEKNVLDEVLNCVDADKMSAYSWLCGELGD